MVAAQTHADLGEVEKADQAAASAPAAVTQAADNWAMGWALTMMANVTSMRGQTADALLLFDRADRDRGRSGRDRPAATGAG